MNWIDKNDMLSYVDFICSKRISSKAHHPLDGIICSSQRCESLCEQTAYRKALCKRAHTHSHSTVWRQWWACFGDLRAWLQWLNKGRNFDPWVQLKASRTVPDALHKLAAPLPAYWVSSSILRQTRAAAASMSNSDRVVLVLGGAGIVGSGIVKALLDKGKRSRDHLAAQSLLSCEEDIQRKRSHILRRRRVFFPCWLEFFVCLHE